MPNGCVFTGREYYGKFGSLHFTIPKDLLFLTISRLGVSSRSASSASSGRYSKYSASVASSSAAPGLDNGCTAWVKHIGALPQGIETLQWWVQSWADADTPAVIDVFKDCVALLSILLEFKNNLR